MAQLENIALHCTGACIFIKCIKSAFSQSLQQNPFSVCEYRGECCKVRTNTHLEKLLLTCVGFKS